MLIETMPQVLTWTETEVVMDQIHGSYIILLSDALSAVASRIMHEDQATGTVLGDAIRNASDQAFMRVLTAPETSYHLLWGPNPDHTTTARHLIRSFRAEEAREGRPVTFTEETWTALGDMGFLADGTRRIFPHLEGLTPLDFGSAYALKLNFEGSEVPPPEPRAGFGEAECALLLNRLREAQQGIAATSSSVLAFVNRFTKVLVLMKNEAASTSFASGSNGLRIALSFLVNPQAPNVDAVLLADGLVHESIHALLYMQERQKAWFHGPQLYHPVIRTVSPWSGTALPIYPYLQACFVWYGLLHFWCLALAQGTFNPSRVRTRIGLSAKGFLSTTYLEQLAPYREQIAPDIWQAVADMQSTVAEAYRSVA